MSVAVGVGVVLTLRFDWGGVHRFRAGPAYARLRRRVRPPAGPRPSR